MSGKTLYDKLWDAHSVGQRADGLSLLYIDRHLLHEVTSPQAFAGLRAAKRSPWRVSANVATADHNVPTTNRELGLDGITDETSLIQLKALDDNCDEFGILKYGIDHANQGIVHIIGPELGFTLPGMTLVCGDSHTSTHGALAVLAQGVGTSEVEHVLATQCLVQNKLGNMCVRYDGALRAGLFAKDMVMAFIGQVGTAGGTGYVLEYVGDAVSNLSMEGRMTLCNMAIEAGARSGLVAVDDTTLEYVRGREFTPQGEQWKTAEAYWRNLVSDAGARFDLEVGVNLDELSPQVTWGTSPEMVCGVDQCIPDCSDDAGHARALEYMGLSSGTRMSEVCPNRIFIGSCTNARIEDLRVAAEVVRGEKLAPGIDEAIVVPGSGAVARQAEEEGLEQIFMDCGFEWRAPGCSMCLGMNPDQLRSGDRCASTSNRNFEGRQGYGGRTHLVSPAMAAAAAVQGHFVNVCELY